MVERVVEKVLIVGCGDLGCAVATQLLESGIKAIGLRRELQQFTGFEMIRADVTCPETLSVLSSIKPQIIIYCVAAGGQSDDEYRSAYVDGLRNVLAAQVDNHQLKHVFFVSSTRVYGQNTELLIDESVEALPADFGGVRLLEAEQLLSSLRCGGTVLRLSGIYGPGRLRMIRLAESPASWPKPNVWSNRIHRDDAAAFIVFMVKQVITGLKLQPCYIVTDSTPVAQHEVLRWLAEKISVNIPEQMQSIAGGKRLSNSRMRATGFELKYHDYRAGYATLLLNSRAK